MKNTQSQLAETDDVTRYSDIGEFQFDPDEENIPTIAPSFSNIYQLKTPKNFDENNIKNKQSIIPNNLPQECNNNIDAEKKYPTITQSEYDKLLMKIEELEYNVRAKDVELNRSKSAVDELTKELEEQKNREKDRVSIHNEALQAVQDQLNLQINQNIESEQSLKKQLEHRESEIVQREATILQYEKENELFKTKILKKISKLETSNMKSIQVLSEQLKTLLEGQIALSALLKPRDFEYTELSNKIDTLQELITDDANARYILELVDHNQEHYYRKYRKKLTQSEAKILENLATCNFSNNEKLLMSHTSSPLKLENKNNIEYDSNVVVQNKKSEVIMALKEITDGLKLAPLNISSKKLPNPDYEDF